MGFAFKLIQDRFVFVLFFFEGFFDFFLTAPLKMPVGTCVRCNESIKRAVNLLEYKDRQFHTNCFTCSICAENIAGPKGFINDPEDPLKQYCHECYSRDVAPKCTKCEEAIVGPEGGVRHRGNPFHRHCFLCHGCGQSLAERRFSVQDGSPYCPECFVDKFAERCSLTSCGKPIAPGTEYLMVDQSDEGKDPLKFHKVLYRRRKWVSSHRCRPELRLGRC